MKKLLVLITAVLVLTLTGCGEKNVEVTLQDYVDAFVEAGYEASLEDKPQYSFINAEDGIIFYVGVKKVAIYEYSSPKALADEALPFASTYGQFALETTSEEAIEIFNNVNSD